MSLSTIRFTGSSLRNVQDGLGVVSDNISNVSTHGFKERLLNFENVQSKTVDGVSYSGSFLVSTGTDFSQGGLEFTDNQSNMAITGNGFFVVQNTSGEMFFTRSGTFNIDSESNLVDSNGNYVLSSGGGRVTFPEDMSTFSINPAGEILIQFDEQESVFLDQIQLADFNNPEGLTNIGSNLYLQTASSGVANFSTALQPGSSTASSRITAGALERSNVDLSDELVDLMTLQRSYQAISRATTTSDELLDTTLGLIR
ncbi:MAG: flagellar hook basal-body protein [Candidatus Caenarcaniphilales bacterium]|nr:flagellar hook basal-body protein [Candidatus Caenarcaniphilales bacterium]